MVSVVKDSLSSCKFALIYTLLFTLHTLSHNLKYIKAERLLLLHPKLLTYNINFYSSKELKLLKTALTLVHNVFKSQASTEIKKNILEEITQLTKMYTISSLIPKSTLSIVLKDIQEAVSKLYPSSSVMITWPPSLAFSLTSLTSMVVNPSLKKAILVREIFGKLTFSDLYNLFKISNLKFPRVINGEDVTLPVLKYIWAKSGLSSSTFSKTIKNLEKKLEPF